MDCLSAYDSVFCFTCNNACLILRRKNLYVVSHRESQAVIGRAEVVVRSFVVQLVIANYLVFGKIVMQAVAFTGKSQYRLVLIRNRKSGQAAYRRKSGCRKRLIEPAACKGNLLFLFGYAAYHAVSFGIQIGIPAPLQLFETGRDELIVCLPSRKQVV